MKKTEPKQTFIKWISVHDQLPKTKDTVLVVIKNEQDPTTAIFDCSYGWIVNGSRRSCSPETIYVLFWSPYNLPK